MNARYLYVFADHTKTMSSVEFDNDMAKRAAMVVSYQHGRFNIVKDRYTLTGTVPVKELL